MTWWRELAAVERRTLIAAFGGWSVDAFDFMIYSFAIPALIAAWGMTRAEAGLIATSTLLFSAAGGWLAGALSDRVGRVRMLQVTIGWFALFTFLSGFSHSFGQLLALRSLQGLGFGGEWAVGAALVSEMIQPQHRGKAVGTVQSGWALGWGAAAMLYAVSFSVLPGDLAWRALFWTGILPALLILYVRRRVPEPAASAAARARAEREPHPERAGEHDAAARAEAGRARRPLGIFAPSLLRTTALASLMATGMQGGYYAVTTWLPTYLKTVRGLSVLDTGGYLVVIVAGSFAGYLTAAWLSDRLGRRACFALFAVGSLLVAVAYTLIPIGDVAMLSLGFPLGFFVSGNFSGVGAFFAELFPGPVRGSGMGFAYSFGRGAGALFPALVGFLSARLPLGTAIGGFAGIAYLLVLAAVIALPETRGRALAAGD
ncbi:MAG: MFS transporter [Candidatus Eisenbacteria bacterium]|nr:MFS transporter [Candidatus Eisenbacteria bacterium]